MKEKQKVESKWEEKFLWMGPTIKWVVWIRERIIKERKKKYQRGRKYPKCYECYHLGLLLPPPFISSHYNIITSIEILVTKQIEEGDLISPGARTKHEASREVVSVVLIPAYRLPDLRPPTTTSDPPSYLLTAFFLLPPSTSLLTDHSLILTQDIKS